MCMGWRVPMNNDYMWCRLLDPSQQSLYQVINDRQLQRHANFTFKIAKCDTASVTERLSTITFGL